MKSAVEFPGNTRIHVGLGVSDVVAATRFYETLLGEAPLKVREGYAKFECEDPSVNLSLNQIKGDARSTNPGSHFGIQMKSTEAVAAAAERLEAAGLAVRKEDRVTCCYAVQDKAWVSDPDGNSWEMFVVTEADTPEFVANRQGGENCCATDSQEACC